MCTYVYASVFVTVFKKTFCLSQINFCLCMKVTLMYYAETPVINGQVCFHRRLFDAGKPQ